MTVLRSSITVLLVLSVNLAESPPSFAANGHQKAASTKGCTSDCCWDAEANGFQCDLFPLPAPHPGDIPPTIKSTTVSGGNNSVGQDIFKQKPGHSNPLQPTDAQIPLNKFQFDKTNSLLFNGQ